MTPRAPSVHASPHTPSRLRSSLGATLVAALSLGLGVEHIAWASPPSAADAPERRLTLVPTAADSRVDAHELDTETRARLVELRGRVDEAPRSREARYDLVRGLMDAGAWTEALSAARDWRAHDAYDLVVVRLLGDIYREMGRDDDALRTYSAVTELLSEDPEAQRALATVLKQRGDLESARGRLARAVDLRPDDARLAFELADVELRLGEVAPARARLEAIVDPDGELEVNEQIRHPARQRLAQVYGAQRRAATRRRDLAAADALGQKLDALEIKGGTVNDIKIFLSWDTNRTDVDLWVTTPTGEKVWYQHRKARDGASLYDDVTSGYGPESFTAPAAGLGEYTIHVNYYGTSRSRFVEARGEVTVVLDEGRPTERQTVLPYLLRKPGETVEVARVEVK